MLSILKTKVCFFKQSLFLVIFKEINIVPISLLLSSVSFSKFSSSDSSKPNIGWFVNVVSTTVFKFGKGVISTFKSISHSVNLTFV